MLKKGMKNLMKLLLLARAAAGMQAYGQINLVQNSSFQTGDFTDWNVTETIPGNNYGVTSGDKDAAGPVPYMSQYGAYFNENGGTMNLSQNVVIPTAGTYNISAWVEPIFSDDDYFTISLGGTVVSYTDFTVGQPYTEISVTVSASAGSQVLDFQFTPNSGAMFFDDASLTAVVTTPVPEPTTLIAGALTLLPFGSSAVRHFRRKLQAARAVKFY
jgi:hypothetical protein